MFGIKVWCVAFPLDDSQLSRHQPSLFKVLSLPDLSVKPPNLQPKSSARVLTSLENIRALEEKEQKKREQLELKEQRKLAREAKQRLKIESMYAFV